MCAGKQRVHSIIQQICSEKLTCHAFWRVWKIAVMTVITSSCLLFGRDALLITEKMFAVCLPARTGWNNIFPCHCEAPQTGCCLRCVDSNPGWTVLVICLISLISHSVHTKYELGKWVRVVWGNGVIVVAAMPLKCVWTLEWLPGCIKSHFCLGLGVTALLSACCC